MRRLGALIVVLALLLTGCGNTTTNTRGTEILFYYCTASEDQSGAGLRGESDQMEALTVPAVLRRLLQQPQSAELTQMIPQGTSVISWEVENGVLTLDLSESFGQLSGISLVRAEYCIVLTVTQLKSVDSVIITVDGRQLPDNGSRTLYASDVLLDGMTEDPITVGTKLYYPLQDGSGLESVERDIELSSLTPVDQANAILRELAVAPVDETHRLDVFLSGTGMLEAVSVADGICTVAVDAGVLEQICNSSSLVDLRIYAIVDSLAELNDVEQVVFLLDGETIDGWQSGYMPQFDF